MINKTNPIQDSLRISDVDNTLTSFCDLSLLSLDHSGQLNFNAKAKYSESFGSGDIALAFGRADSYSIEGMMMILDRMADKTIFSSTSEHPVFSFNKGRYLSISSNKNSGETNSKSFENKSSRVTPSEEIKAANNIFASMTAFMPDQAPYFCMCRSCIPFLIFLPRSKASFSVNLDLAVMAFKIANWLTFSRMAALATSDQFISLNSSISRFKSSGTDKVIVGISAPPINMFNTQNTHNIFKSFAS